MKRYRNPRLEEIESFLFQIIGTSTTDFLKVVDSYLLLFPATLNIYPLVSGGVQVEYEFDNAGHDYIEICFFTDGHIELYHNYENPDMDIEYEENATSTDVQEIADRFQEIISKINIYS